ncbi:hypothetical protein EC968_006601 [Mortierella alpina]|nr:hypothetical protein EC968_006601 [Mortierella alpina]
MLFAKSVATVSIVSALDIDISASQLCIHEKCFGSSSYCAVRYSYVTVSDARNIDSTRYLIPTDSGVGDTFKGKCYKLNTGGSLSPMGHDQGWQDQEYRKWEMFEH